MQHPLGFLTSAGVFSYGTLLGGAARVPLGTGVTGSAMILALEEAGGAGRNTPGRSGRRAAASSRVRTRRPARTLCDIDEGTEQWIHPSALPPVEGGRCLQDVDFFTFLPDFTPNVVIDALRPLEARLERSRLLHWSAHDMACLVKEPVEMLEAEGAAVEDVLALAPLSARTTTPTADALRPGRRESGSLRRSRESA